MDKRKKINEKFVTLKVWKEVEKLLREKNALTVEWLKEMQENKRLLRQEIHKLQSEICENNGLLFREIYPDISEPRYLICVPTDCEDDYIMEYENRGYDCTGQMFTSWTQRTTWKGEQVTIICNSMDI